MLCSQKYIHKQIFLIFQETDNKFEILSFHGDDSGCGLLVCDSTQSCGRIATFQRTMLPQLNRHDSKILQNVDILPHDCVTLQPRRPRLEVIKQSPT
jgi:hypothetical protein